MKKLPAGFIVFTFFISIISAQTSQFNLKEEPKGLNLSSRTTTETNSFKEFQLKKRKTVNTYFGAGYSFMIFTDSYMQDAFPVLDTRSGTFLTNINLFIGFAVAKAVTLEFEPTILFTSNTKTVDYALSQSYQGNSYAHTYSNNLLAFPLVVNARFFPFFKMSTSFARLFFLGGGVGGMWIREENDIYFNNTPTGYFFGNLYATQSTSQWAPIFRLMTGFTGSGGQFGFGGEVRFNIVPLKQDKSKPFATRFSSNANSVDITLRFYFSL